jgi:hypothetical protein
MDGRKPPKTWPEFLHQHFVGICVLIMLLAIVLFG